MVKMVDRIKEPFHVFASTTYSNSGTFSTTFDLKVVDAMNTILTDINLPFPKHC